MISGERKSVMVWTCRGWIWSQLMNIIPFSPFAGVMDGNGSRPYSREEVERYLDQGGVKPASGGLAMVWRRLWLHVLPANTRRGIDGRCRDSPTHPPIPPSLRGSCRTVGCTV